MTAQHVPMTRLEKWDRRYLRIAKEVSTWSKDPSTQVGVVLVNPQGHIVATGYNGFPRQIADTPERWNTRETKYQLVVHAEVNAILQAGERAKGATLYIYPSFMLPPICQECAKVAITAGVTAIVGYNPDVNDERVKRWAGSISVAREMWNEAQLGVRSYDEN